MNASRVLGDPAGKLRLTIANPHAVHSYRQGSERARFQLCGDCGVLVAVLFEHGGRNYGAVNAGCLDGDATLAAAASASPQLLSVEEKVARWLQVWVPDVRLFVAGDRPQIQVACENSRGSFSGVRPPGVGGMHVRNDSLYFLVRGFSCGHFCRRT